MDEKLLPDETTLYGGTACGECGSSLEVLKLHASVPGLTLEDGRKLRPALFVCKGEKRHRWATLVLPSGAPGTFRATLQATNVLG